MSKVKRPSLGQKLVSKSYQIDSDLWSAWFGSKRSFRKNHVHFRICNQKIENEQPTHQLQDVVFVRFLNWNLNRKSSEIENVFWEYFYN